MYIPHPFVLQSTLCCMTRFFSMSTLYFCHVSVAFFFRRFDQCLTFNWLAVIQVGSLLHASRNALTTIRATSLEDQISNERTRLEEPVQLVSDWLLSELGPEWCLWWNATSVWQAYHCEGVRVIVCVQRKVFFVPSLTRSAAQQVWSR